MIADLLAMIEMSNRPALDRMHTSCMFVPYFPVNTHHLTGQVNAVDDVLDGGLVRLIFGSTDDTRQ